VLIVLVGRDRISNWNAPVRALVQRGTDRFWQAIGRHGGS
jgi:hypothetical protein